jgi:acyl-CoA synthetase (AMP-forming)/AMP-acid ligase II
MARQKQAPSCLGRGQASSSLTSPSAGLFQASRFASSGLMAMRSQKVSCGFVPPANMRGYLNLPTKTQEVLAGDRWYKSGDVFGRDEAGAYTFVGRTDDMFVCGGENIYPGEVESRLEDRRTDS